MMNTISKFIEQIINLPIELLIPFGIWFVIIILMVVKLIKSMMDEL